jgi:hypothetical protein
MSASGMSGTGPSESMDLNANPIDIFSGCAVSVNASIDCQTTAAKKPT